MKKIFTSVLFAAAVMGLNAQSIGLGRYFEEIPGQFGGALEIDLNNDGLLDLIYGQQFRDAAGRMVEDKDGNEVQLAQDAWSLTWNGSDYTIKSFPYVFGQKVVFAPADFNCDGNMDFYVCSDQSNYDSTGAYTLGMFLGDGKGNFTPAEIEIKDAQGQIVPFWEPRVADVADFNSDGLPDLVTAGWKDIEGARHAFTGILVNKGGLKFELTNEELMMVGDNPMEFNLVSIYATDLNNDGYADFMVQGNVDNENASDKPMTQGGVTVGRGFFTYLNIGADSEPGEVSLYDLDLAGGVSHTYGHGAMKAADINNDGVMDIVVGGESPDDARGGGQWEYYWQYLTGRITSDGVVYTNVNAPFTGRDIRPLGDTNGGLELIDYNGNGQYDVFLMGWCTNLLSGEGNRQCGWFFPNNNGALSDYKHIPGASECCTFFLENGVSGARYLGFDGYVGDDAFEIPGNRHTIICTNPFTKAARPDAPQGLNANVEDHNVTLSWAPAASSLKNVTYDYYIKDVNGKIYSPTYAYVGGELDGVRQVLRQGKAFMAKTITLQGLPDGDYEWGVQTVNAGLEGSKFATGETFRIGEGSGVETIAADADATPVRYYNLQGIEVNRDAKGLLILSNGTKIMNK